MELNVNAHVIIKGKRTDFSTLEDFETFFNDNKHLTMIDILGLSDIKCRRHSWIYICDDIEHAVCIVIKSLKNCPHIKLLNLTSDWATGAKSVFNQNRNNFTEEFIEQVSEYIRTNLDEICMSGDITVREFESFKNINFTLDTARLHGIVSWLNEYGTCLESLILKGVKFELRTYNEIRNYIVSNKNNTQIYTDFSRDEKILQDQAGIRNIQSHSEIVLSDHDLKFGSKLQLTIKGHEELETCFDKLCVLINSKMSPRDRGIAYDFVAENGICGYIVVEDEKVIQIWITRSSVMSSYYSIDYKDGSFWYDKKVCNRGRMSKIESGEIGLLDNVIIYKEF